MTTMQAAIDTIARLEANKGNLSFRDSTFAQSLLSAWYGKRATGKQWEWIVRLSERAAAPKSEPATVNLWNICKMFSVAIGAFARPPKLTLRVDSIGKVRIAFCGPRSKYHGSFNVTDGRAFGDNIFYGRIDSNGNFHPSAHSTPELIAALEAFNANPAESATTHGHMSGNCMFCSKTLTDSRSVTVGYGPDCAENWGLPWGS